MRIVRAFLTDSG